MDISSATLQEIAGGLLQPHTGAEPEVIHPQYPVGCAWRYGIFPNDQSLDTLNTERLRALLDPKVVGIRGWIYFPNLCGDAVYYFNDRVPVRDWIYLELCGSRFNVVKTGDVTDTYGGFLHALRHFEIRNGVIEIDYTHTAGVNTFNALCFGGRGDTAIDFHPLWDNEEPEPFGDIGVRNVEIDYSGGQYSKAVYMLGGLQDVTFETTRINGNGTLDFGVGYEFGFATGGTAKYRESSHAHNLTFDNVTCRDLAESASGAGIRLAGVYNAKVTNYKQTGGNNGIVVAPGEALFYRPWKGVDDIGKTRRVNIENAAFSGLEGNCIDGGGASANTGYLKDIDIPPHQRVGLCALSVDGFTADYTTSSGPGFAVHSSCGQTDIKNGHILGAAKGVVLTQEAAMFGIEAVDILDSGSIGIQVGLNVNICNPPRKQMGTIKRCHIAGSGALEANSAITVSNSEIVTVSNCRFGYEELHDGKDETTQATAISVQAGGFVRAVDNYVAGAVSGTAYYAAAGGEGVLVNGRGLNTTSARWT